MKFYLLLGGTCGFLVAFSSGLVAGSELPLMLRNGALGCLAGALLMKGYYKIQMMCVRKLVLAKQKERTEGDEPNVNKE